jgi:hypothetical protein
MENSLVKLKISQKFKKRRIRRKTHVIYKNRLINGEFHHLYPQFLIDSYSILVMRVSFMPQCVCFVYFRNQRFHCYCLPDDNCGKNQTVWYFKRCVQCDCAASYVPHVSRAQFGQVHLAQAVWSWTSTAFHASHRTHRRARFHLGHGVMRRPPFTRRKTPDTHFCQRLSRPQGHNAAGRERSTEKYNDLIGNRTRDLPACSIMPQPTMLPRTSGKTISRCI